MDTSYRQEEWYAAYNPTPEHGILYHYTTPSGALGIIECGEVWATDLAFLNDSREMLHGLDIAAELILEHEDAKFGSLILFLLSRFRVNPLNVARTCVACFCDDGDLLGQWRGYGQQGGYALGLDYGDLESHLTDREAGIIWVEYDRARQRALMTEHLLDALEEWPALRETLPDPDAMSEDFEVPEPLRKFGEKWAGRIAAAAITFKDPSFMSEREWRLVENVDAEKHRTRLRFRPGLTGLTPYLCLDLAFEDGRLPLRHVVVSPGAFAEHREAAMRMLLWKHGYDLGKIVISRSSILFRPSVGS